MGPSKAFLWKGSAAGFKLDNLFKLNGTRSWSNKMTLMHYLCKEDAIRNIFSLNTATEFQDTSLLIFFLLYCILGVITVGIVVPSGLFIQIILMGSGYGRLLGIAMRPYTKIDQGLYVVLGAASLMAGSTRMTSIYKIMSELKGLPFLEAHPEPWMRNITVGELAGVRTPVVTLHEIEKVRRIVEVLKYTTHNGFPFVDIVIPELHGLIIRTHLLLVLKKKWFLNERITKDCEVWGEIHMDWNLKYFSCRHFQWLES
ncbi:Chloride channel protein CLC-b [Capsicum annuum]|nr:Chloride channel protein CLC-b [Capsicum annuum]